MTLYTRLRHAGYFAPGLTDTERDAIEADVAAGGTSSETPRESTTSADLGATTNAGNATATSSLEASVPAASSSSSSAPAPAGRRGRRHL